MLGYTTSLYKKINIFTAFGGIFTQVCGMGYKFSAGDRLPFSFSFLYITPIQQRIFKSRSFYTPSRSLSPPLPSDSLPHPFETWTSQQHFQATITSSAEDSRKMDGPGPSSKANAAARALKATRRTSGRFRSLRSLVMIERTGS